MVIPDVRSSPVCSARATALRGERRAADLVPDWLRFSTLVDASPRRNNCQDWWIGPLGAAPSSFRSGLSIRQIDIPPCGGDEVVQNAHHRCWGLDMREVPDTGEHLESTTRHSFVSGVAMGD